MKTLTLILFFLFPFLFWVKEKPSPQQECAGNCIVKKQREADNKPGETEGLVFTAPGAVQF